MGAVKCEKDVPLCCQAKGTPSPRATTYLVSIHCNPLCFKEERDLYQTIEDLRRELVRLVQEKGSFTDEVVVELSQRLDGYIYAIQSGRYIRSNITTEEG